MKTKEKPKYNTLQNVGWMVNIAWKNGKRTLLFCLLTAALEVLLNLVQLYIAPEVLATVHEGLLHSRRIAVEYRAVEADKARRFEINPTALVYMGQVGYLVGTLWDYNDLRHLALHRMSKPELLETPATLPQDFDLGAYLREQSAFDFPGTEELRLHLRVQGWMARHLEERRLSKDQRIAPEAEVSDTWIVQATVRESERLVWWLRSHGEAVEVIAPAALRQRLAGEFSALAARYSEGGS